MRMKEESLKEFVDFIIQERMQKAFSQVKAGKEPDNEDDVERKYEEAVALLPEEKHRMKAIRFILKIMLLPVIIALTVIRLFAEFLAGISAVIFRSIAGIFLLTALLSYGFGLESTGECLKMVLAGFLFYLLPCTIEIVIAGIILLEEYIRSFT